VRERELLGLKEKEAEAALGEEPAEAEGKRE